MGFLLLGGLLLTDGIGVFGVPLELLVEREGADSLHGSSRTPLRVPSFIDDVVSAMRQMGMCAAPHCVTMLMQSRRHVRGGNLPQKWEHPTSERTD